jgi:hypothetical protein
MNRTANRLAMAGLLLAMSCGPGVLTLGSTYTLQGIVADAITGARVGGDLKLFLVQGPEVRGPARLITGTTDPLMGEYAFTGIPVAYNSGDNVWKVVVVKTGYQRFESEVTFPVSTIDEDASGPNAILDGAFSKIGNIYLFPVGVPAPDYKFTFTYNNKPVPNATVQLDPISASNAGAFTVGSSTLPAFNGYVPSLTATTDANGAAVFAGATLSVGAAYKPQVLPVQFKETATATPIQLALFNPAGASLTFIAGLGSSDQHLTLAAVPPTPAGIPLYVTSESNFITSSLQSDGKLVVTFSIPVAVQSIDGYTAALNPGTKADGSAGTGALNATKPVNATLSTDGLTLTLAPNYATAPAGTERGLSITYDEGPPPGAAAGVTAPVIEPKDYPASAFSLFGTGPGTQLKLVNGATVTAKVQMTAP